MSIGPLDPAWPGQPGAVGHMISPMTETSAVPAAPVPPGPGVQPPFPAPPAEGSGIRLGWGLGIASLALVLCCGGGLAATVGFVVTGVEAVNEQGRAVVSHYLDALRKEDYQDAYDLLCDAEQERLTPQRFESRERARPKPASYDLGEIDLQSNDIKLPVTEHYSEGRTEQHTYFLAQDSQTAQLEVCGRE